MLDGAISQGMKRADAMKILVGTLFSLAKLLEDGHPAVLREKISSPKGTTIAGLLRLQEDRVRYMRIVVQRTRVQREVKRSGSRIGYPG